MPLRRGWLVLWFACLGCHSLCLDMDRDPAQAEQLWLQGQQAMRDGQPERAIGFYEQSLAADPARTRNHMSLAAAYLEKGDEEAACKHLERYVAAHPEHVLIRSHHAELLLRLDRPREARAQFERFVADAQDEGESLVKQMNHGHTRLMEIAQRQEDEYGKHLHRGLGLYWLACERATLGAPRGELPVEGLLCKAAAALDEARGCRPGAARPCWYLYRIWSRLARTEAARRCLAQAQEAAPLGDLTPAEQRSLVLVGRTAPGRPLRP
jgi:tetratricopeptide (TPR) repeat protein